MSLERVGAASCLLAALLGCEVDEGHETKPNIVFVLADDLGCGDLSGMNPRSGIPTPELDRLARTGMRFTNAYAPSSLCSPTRYGVLTGRYAWRSRLKKRVLVPWEQSVIEAGTVTMPGLLRGAGYHCAALGKWHLGWNWRTSDGAPPAPLSNGRDVIFDRPITGGPVDCGFDSFFGIDAQGYPPYCYIENDRVVAVPTVMRKKAVASRRGMMVEGWDDAAVLPETTRRALEYLEARRVDGKPFFLYLPLNAPHVPHVPTKEFHGKSKAGKYGDYVCQVDSVVGRIRAALEETGLDRNTLLIVTSDNGSGASPAGHDSNGPFRGGKGDIYEGGLRVPFIAHWPGRVAAGAVSDQVVSLVDLLATAAALAEIPVPKGAAIDSYDMSPILLGRTTDEVRDGTVLSSARGTAIRKGRWKLIRGSGPLGLKPTPKLEKGSSQLFDLVADPGETNNLHAENPEVVAELSELLRRHQKSGR